MSRPAKRRRPRPGPPRNVRDGTERRRGRVTVQNPQIRVVQVGLALSVVAAMTGGVVEGVVEGVAQAAGSTTSGSEQIEVTVPPVPTTTTVPPRWRHGQGFWLTTGGGAVVSEGGAINYGSSLGRQVGGRNVGLVATHDRKGYWEVSADGVVSAFGDARNYGQPARGALAAPIVGMAATRDDGGYWLVGATGTVYPFGDAQATGRQSTDLGSTVVGIAAGPVTTSDGNPGPSHTTTHGDQRSGPSEGSKRSHDTRSDER